MAHPNDEPPFQGGSQPVAEHPPEMPTRARSATQIVVLVVAGLVVVAGLLYLFGIFAAG